LEQLFFRTVNTKRLNSPDFSSFLGLDDNKVHNMKIPKSIKRYCPFCKKHTEHKVSQNKKKNPSSLKKGSKYRARRRGQARGFGNLGRYSKPAISKFKRTGAKRPTCAMSARYAKRHMPRSRE
jgi:ribosomal protein L44E